ncbi:MAG: hypothetical protein FWG85_08025 [Bacteroidetes bacterium]|nr:hypothetical protein [Bacteroidota bacterium]
MKRFFLSFLTLLLSISVKAQWSILDAEADSIVRAGTNYIYNLDFTDAERCFKEVQNKLPAHPAGYFLDAMIDWWRLTIDKPRSEKFKDVFLNKIKKAIDVCDAILDTNKKNINALFFKGGALGYRGRYYADEESWVKAVSDANAALDVLIECLKVAPNNHDIMLGTGIYNYFAAAIPEQYPIVKPLMLFIPSGDKKIGEYQLKSAASKARYASIEAKVVLMQVYYTFEKKSWEALDIAKELFQKYPNNPYFKKYYARCLVRTGDYNNFEKYWREILKDCIDKKFGYNNDLARESMYYIALALIRKKDYSLALRYLVKCEEGSKEIDKKKHSSFIVMCNLWMGKVYDLQENRNNAISQYKKVLKMTNYSTSHEEAQRYLEKPFKQ